MSVSISDEEFNKMFSAMKSRFIEKEAKHGNSWKTAGMIAMWKRVEYMFDLFMNAVFDANNKPTKVLVDLANQVMLLYLRLEGK